MRHFGTWSLFVAAALLGPPRVALAQEPTRTTVIEQEQAAKVPTLKPYQPNAGEKWAQRGQNILTGTGSSWHPFFQNAYSGGGFTLGGGYNLFVSPYNSIDMRGSYTFLGYKRLEAEFRAPRLFHRRGELSVLGGWREATQVGFFGIGNGTASEDRTDYQFDQPYLSGLFTLWPNRNRLMLRAGLEWSQWNQGPGEGDNPSVETRYTADTLPGLGAEVPYLHTQATVGLDFRTAPGYSRRGGYIGVTGHDYTDSDEQFGFQRVDYEAIQHIPILREAWVISLRGVVSTAYDKDGQDIPFFMLPALGGGSNLRGFSSWRFRDHSALLLQGEWRIMLNRFFETAVFYDTGKVAPRPSELDLDHLKHDWGFGVRFHNLFVTPLRVDFAKSNEGLSIVFASSAVF